MKKGDPHLLNPRQSEELAPLQLLLPHRLSLGRPIAKYTLQIPRLRLQPSLNELRWLFRKRLEECSLHVGVVQRLSK